MQNLEEFRKALDKSDKIVIIPHRRPDADALGSCLAMAGYLKKKGLHPQVVSPDDYPAFLHWMHGNEEVLIYENQYNSGHKKKAEAAIAEADMIFCLDFSSLDRIENLKPFVSASAARKVLIDHHLGKSDFADFEMWDTSAAATAELVFDLVSQMGDRHLLDVGMAECIYAGIMTDTGSFKYSSTSSKVHRIVADLLDLGIKAERIHRLIFDTNTEKRIKFLGYALDKKLTILREYKTAYISITAGELKRFESRTGDTEGLVNYALSIEGIRLAAMFIDRTEAINISFRSVGDFAVNEFASKHFNGGGHKNAAGGKVGRPLKDVVGKFLGLLDDYQAELVSPEE